MKEAIWLDAHGTCGTRRIINKINTTHKKPSLNDLDEQQKLIYSLVLEGKYWCDEYALACLKWLPYKRTPKWVLTRLSRVTAFYILMRGSYTISQVYLTIISIFLSRVLDLVVIGLLSACMPIIIPLNKLTGVRIVMPTLCMLTNSHSARSKEARVA